MAQRKTPAKKSTQRTTKKKTTSRKPSSKANNGTKPTRTSKNTPKSKSTKTKNDDYLTMADFRKFKAGAGELAGQFKRGLKAQAAEHKAKKQAKKDEKNAKYIEKYNKKLNLTKDENGVIETDNDIKKIEPSPLDRSERTKKKRFKFW